MPPDNISKQKMGEAGLNLRKARFREKNGLIAWISRNGSPVLKRETLKHLSAQDIANNTTRNFTGLTKEELEAIRVENKKMKEAKKRGKNAGQSVEIEEDNEEDIESEEDDGEDGEDENQDNYEENEGESQRNILVEETNELSTDNEDTDGEYVVDDEEANA